MSTYLLVRQRGEATDNWTRYEMNRYQEEVGIIEFDKDIRKSLDTIFNQMRSQIDK